MTIGLGLVCIGVAVMLVALAALVICGVVALVDRLRDLGGARYSRVERGRGAAAAPPARSRARLI